MTTETKLSNKQKKWQKKVQILSSMEGSVETKRQRAVHQMGLSGDEWVRMMKELGIKSSFGNKSKKK